MATVDWPKLLCGQVGWGGGGEGGGALREVQSTDGRTGEAGPGTAGAEPHNMQHTAAAPLAEPPAVRYADWKGGGVMAVQYATNALPSPSRNSPCPDVVAML